MRKVNSISVSNLEKEKKRKSAFCFFGASGQKGLTKVIGKTPINFSWAKLSLLTPGQVAGSWF